MRRSASTRPRSRAAAAYSRRAPMLEPANTQTEVSTSALQPLQKMISPAGRQTRRLRGALQRVDGRLAVEVEGEDVADRDAFSFVANEPNRISGRDVALGDDAHVEAGTAA